MDTSTLLTRLRAFLAAHQATTLLVLGALIVLAAWQVMPTNGLPTDQQASIADLVEDEDGSLDETVADAPDEERTDTSDTSDGVVVDNEPSSLVAYADTGDDTEANSESEVDPRRVTITGFDEDYLSNLWQQAFGRPYPFGDGFPYGSSNSTDGADEVEEETGEDDTDTTTGGSASGSSDENTDETTDTDTTDENTEDDGPTTYPGGSGGGSSSGGSGTEGGDGGSTEPSADTTAPTVAALTPSEISDTITFVADASDPVVPGALTSGVAYVRFYVDDAFVRSTSTAFEEGTYQVHVDSNEFADGLHTYGAVAVDGAGNRSATSTREFEINNVPQPIDEDVLIESVSNEAIVTSTDSDDTGTYTVTFDLTAVGADQFISATTTSVFLYRIEGGLGDTVATATVASISSTALVEGDSYRLTAGDTETFTLVVTLDPDTTDSYRAEFDGIVFGSTAAYPYGTSSVAAPDTDFETPYVYLEGSRTSEPQPESPFVKGGVTLTLDDANQSQYTYIYSLMSSLGMVGTLYVPTGFVGEDTYVTWEQLVEMQNAGWDIGGHSVDHLELPTLTDEDEIAEIDGSHEALTSHGLTGESFALPFGAYDVDTMANIAHTYDSNRHYHHQGLNAWPFNKYFLHVQRILNTTTLEEAKGWVDAAVAGDHWLVITLHEVIPGGDPEDETTWSTENLEALLHYMKDTGVTPRTVADMLDQGPNLVPGGSFETGLSNGWTTDAPSFITHDTTGMGAYPESMNSMMLSSGDAPTHIFSNSFAVEAGEDYGVRAYVDTRALTAGEVGFYVDEYDAEGNWISGKWLGQAGINWVIDEVFTYVPTSEAVADARLQVIVTSRTEGVAYIDEVEVFN